jgi:hypothetical protein
MKRADRNDGFQNSPAARQFSHHARQLHRTVGFRQEPPTLGQIGFPVRNCANRP